MDRIKATDVTDALMRAMDQAGDYDHVIIILDRSDRGRIITDNKMTIAEANYALDYAKIWMLQSERD